MNVLVFLEFPIASPTFRIFFSYCMIIIFVIPKVYKDVLSTMYTNGTVPSVYKRQR